MESAFIGIDPGKSGAIAVSDFSGQVIKLVNCPVAGSMPDRREITNILQSVQASYPNVVAGIEKVRAGRGARSMLTYGINYGVWLMGLTMIGARIHEVRVYEWKKTFGLQVKGSTRAVRKRLSILKAKDLFPAEADYITNDGLAEALLIAEHIRRLYVFTKETKKKK